MKGATTPAEIQEALAKRFNRWDRKRRWKRRLEKAWPWLLGAAVGALVWWATG